MRVVSSEMTNTGCGREKRKPSQHASKSNRSDAPPKQIANAMRQVNHLREGFLDDVFSVESMRGIVLHQGEYWQADGNELQHSLYSAFRFEVLAISKTIGYIAP